MNESPEQEYNRLKAALLLMKNPTVLINPQCVKLVNRDNSELSLQQIKDQIGAILNLSNKPT